MQVPFTQEQFFEVFKKYNDYVFPVQFIFHLIALIIFYLILRKKENYSRGIFFITGLIWLWTGIVYHLLFFSEINKAAYIFGLVFILQAFFLYYMFIKDKKLDFSDPYARILSGAMMTYALLVYPVLGYFSEHSYPFSPTFGLPCPLTIFTIGLILLSKDLKILLFAIPFLWSLLGFTAVSLFGVYEDAGLIISSLLFILYMVFRKISSVRVKTTG